MIDFGSHCGRCRDSVRTLLRESLKAACGVAFVSLTLISCSSGDAEKSMPTRSPRAASDWKHVGESTVLTSGTSVFPENKEIEVLSQPPDARKRFIRENSFKLQSSARCEVVSLHDDGAVDCRLSEGRYKNKVVVVSSAPLFSPTTAPRPETVPSSRTACQKAQGAIETAQVKYDLIGLDTPREVAYDAEIAAFHADRLIESCISEHKSSDEFYDGLLADGKVLLLEASAMGFYHRSGGARPADPMGRKLDDLHDHAVILLQNVRDDEQPSETDKAAARSLLQGVE